MYYLEKTIALGAAIIGASPKSCWHPYRQNDIYLCMTSVTKLANHRPHIAFVLPGVSAGGSEHIVSLLCNHLSRSGWQVSLHAFDDASIQPYYDHDPAVRISFLGRAPCTHGLWSAQAEVRKRVMILRRELLQSRPDLVVSFLTRTNVVSVLAAGPLRVPVIVSERNNPQLQRPGIIWSVLRRYAYARAYGLVAMTKGAMSQFSPAVRRRHWVIPNPTYAPLQVDPDRECSRQVAAVGRLVPQKGFDLLLRAFAAVADRVPDWSLVIWGEGPERGRLEALRDALGLTDRVKMPGVTQVHGGWLHNADIFVLSSRFEGWGIVVGEAMAAGVATISFDCRWGPSEMITNDQSGVLVPDGDVDALGEAIASLCQDPARRSRLAQGARVAAKRFEVDEIMRQWESVLLEAANVKSRAGAKVSTSHGSGWPAPKL